MKPLLFLANAFIDTFGITRPSEQSASRAARFIAILLGTVILIGVIADQQLTRLRNRQRIR